MSATIDLRGDERSPAPRRWVTLALSAAALLALGWLLWSHWGGEALGGWMRQASPAYFFAAAALLPALGVPLTPLFVLAGATFGVRLGLLVSLAALAANLTLCYWVASSGLRPWLASLLRALGQRLPDFRERRRGEARFALLVKLAPGLPGFAKNYALGIAGVSFWLYFALGMLVTGAYAAGLVVMGESLLHHERSRVLGAGAALLVLGAALAWWRRRRRPSHFA